MGYCRACGEWADKIYNGMCTSCNTKTFMAIESRSRQSGEEALAKWQALVAKQPTRALTEEQWIEACSYFGGCAYCGNPEVSSRSMFISFAQGGRYTAWNIVPACEKCETAIKRRPNPFIRLDSFLNRAKSNTMRSLNQDKEALDKITTYLRSKMEVQDESGKT